MAYWDDPHASTAEMDKIADELHHATEVLVRMIGEGFRFGVHDRRLLVHPGSSLTQAQKDEMIEYGAAMFTIMEISRVAGCE